MAAHAALDALSPEDAGKGAALFQTAYDLIRQGIDTIPEADRTVKKMPEPPKVIDPCKCPAGSGPSSRPRRAQHHARRDTSLSARVQPRLS